MYFLTDCGFSTSGKESRSNKSLLCDHNASVLFSEGS